MKKAIFAFLGMGLMLGVAIAQDTKPAPKAATPPAPTGADLKQQASYSFGVNIGKNFKSQGVDLDPDAIAKGIKDGLVGKSALTDEQIQKCLQEFSQQVEAKQAELAKAAGAKNKKDGDAFLAANKAKPGVATTKSGLQYKVVKDGTGKVPKASDAVKVHYEGRLIDGTVFDSSLKRGEPAVFPVDAVIPGWTEALQLMKVGSKYQLFIPAALAYGEQAQPGSPIGPNSVLVFDVELLGIENPPGAPAPKQ